MEKDPDDRFDSASDMGRAALAAVPGGGDTGARARLAAARTRLPPPRRRRLWALLAALAAAVAVVAVAVVLVGANDDAEGEPETAGAPPSPPGPAAAKVIGDPIPVGDGPGAVAVGGGGVWVANTAAETVTYVNARRLRIRRQIPVGEDPVAISAGPAAVWVANFGDRTVSKIDISARRVTATIPVGAAPVDLASPSGSVWVATEANRLLRIDTRSDQVTPGALRVRSRGAVSAGGDRVWVLDTFDGQVRSVDARSGLLTGAPVPLGRFPVDVAAGVTEAWASVAGDGTVQKVPAFVEGPDAKTVQIGGRPERLALDRRWLWVTDSDRDVVVRVDTRAGTVSGDVVPVPEDPSAIATGGDGRIWVTSAGADTLTRLESR
jgi:serine/threonine-protein kinase